MSSARVYNYESLRLKFIRGSMSLRELAEEASVRSPSALTRVARMEGWAKEREEFRTRRSAKTVELLAESDAKRQIRVAEVTDEAIEMTAEMIDQVRGRMRNTRTVERRDPETGGKIYIEEPELLVSVKDLGKLLGGLDGLAGKVAAPASGDRRDISISVPEGTKIGLIAQYVDRVRAEGGPIDDVAAGDEGPLSLPDGSPGAG